jgi:acyl-CoA thioesterase FadM
MMSLSTLGYVSNITRVETWECDYNGHWNTRFYTRAFQCAAETFSMGDGKVIGSGSAGASIIRSRHIRFHQELHSGDPVLVRSAAILGGFWNGAIVHVLESEGTLSATALDVPANTPSFAEQHLSQVSESVVAYALPRGLVDNSPLVAPSHARRANLGILRPSSYDHTGALMIDELFRYIGYATYDHHGHLGYTPQFTTQTGLTRMVVEMRATWLGHAPAGAVLCSLSWLLQVEGKSFATAHLLQTQDDRPVALIELCLVSVDMKTRRAVQVPDFLLSQAKLLSQM